ncbi:MAG: cupin domain-containing protein [Heliobacteriaceae bacterium]|nr:cupin domain-containing protein [Heliobacteriaceae bacterium]MDD4587526.1 cupin domain-containing protein [Heliobacteriaceae bacterium]
MLSENMILTHEEFVPHPTNEGVLVRHLFTSEHNGRLNNAEIRVAPGCRIAPHVHEGALETMYVVSGKGEFLVGDTYQPVEAGNAMLAPQGVVHGVKAAGPEPLVMFCTFSPATK